MKMTFEEAKSHKQNLEAINKLDSDKLKEFDKYGEGVMGMTPDHVRAMSEWQLAKRNFQESFNKLREFNGWYVKAFKKELLAERRNRYSRKAI